jgi:hypothetical protein
MSVHTALAVSALAGSLFLVFGASARVVAVVALLASAVEVAMAFGWLHLALARIPLGLVLALALAVPGVIAWLRSGGKSTVTASSVVAFVGVLQVALIALAHR